MSVKYKGLRILSEEVGVRSGRNDDGDAVGTKVEAFQGCIDPDR